MRNFASVFRDRTYKTERDVWREQGAFQLQEEIQTQVRSSISAMNGFPVFFPFEIGQGLFKIRFSQSAFRLVQWDQTHHLILRNSWLGFPRTYNNFRYSIAFSIAHAWRNRRRRSDSLRADTHGNTQPITTCFLCRLPLNCINGALWLI